MRGVGRSGASEEGAGGLCLGVGNRSRPGMVARSPLIMQPEGAVWTCQSRPEERRLRNLRRGLCAWGLPRE